MDFWMSTLGDYSKALTLQTKWQQKKNTGRIAEKELTPTEQKNEAFKQSYYEMKEQEPEVDQTLSEIRTKIEYGQKLTPDEVDYLRSHDPQAYQSVRRTEQAAKQYERELKRCKTKEEVQNLRMEKANESLARIRSISNNPNIPEEKKLEFAAQEQRHMDALNRVHTRFVEKGGYEQLPTENERNKAMQDLKAADQAEQDARLDSVRETQEKQENGAADLPDAKEQSEADALTRLEAESTPEAEKVRRAKAKAEYCQYAELTDADDPIRLFEA